MVNPMKWLGCGRSWREDRGVIGGHTLYLGVIPY